MQYTEEESVIVVKGLVLPSSFILHPSSFVSS
jgi:hypothetical protein